MAGSGPELHIKTPLLESIPMTKVAGCPVYIKCDNMQPTASFKIRGIGLRCKKALEAGYTRIISSSGGNAGYAAAYAARQLGMPATVVIPESTSKFMADKIRGLGADVIVHGKVWDYANEHALQLAKEDSSAVVIHPFDHPDIWEGHESIIVEIQDQLHGKKPDVVVTCVGGGGLLCGVVQGLQTVGWGDVPVVAMETFGAESFNAAVKAGKLVTLPDITSMCKCLGALQVSPKCLEYHSKYPILSCVVPDKDAIGGCLRLLDDHRILVEPACGAAVSAVYSDVLGELRAEGKLPKKLGCVVVIVCGGGAINLQMLLKFKEDCNL
ncbi:L-serine dehydratase/L-threonine deaminase isoform X2 [Strongylocentrotus purpuratus]|uniref:L-serine ammonia-lyase n=1 Tax=Strongylocentrotus purpuratus TaxID=7668 RepID=A0A7M7PAL1_STRPU|nr:L-serine dehydratase/L-threonine deaminase isoform X2 [Strongylocentrotus purpuratus]